MNRMTNLKRAGVCLLAVAAVVLAAAGACAATARYSGGSYDGYDRNDAQPSMGILTVDNAGGATSVPPGVPTNSASLNGTLWDTEGTQTEVFVYWGPSDGGTNKLAWTNRYDFGVGTAVQWLTATVTGLIQNTAYYYRFYASDVAGQEAWAPTSVYFGPPAVNVNAGATAVGLSVATLNGNLTAGGNSLVVVCWGEDTNTAAASTNLGILGQGTVLAAVSGLRVGATYYYRCAATNAYGTAWSGVASFRTLSAAARFGGGSYDGYDAMTLNLSFAPGLKGTVFSVR